MRNNAGKAWLLLIICGICLGCDDGTYVAEKMYWHAARHEQEMVKRYPQGLPKDKLDEIILRYREIALKAPFWKGAIHVYFKLAHLYESNKNFTAAEKAYEQVCKDFPFEVEYCANALRMIAINYEEQNEWGKAEKIYDRIHREYSYSLVGLMVPIYVAQRYNAMGKAELSSRKMNEALEFYSATIQSDISQDVTIEAIELIAQCFAGLGREQEGVAFFEKLAQENEGKVTELRSLYKLAQLYYRKKDEFSRGKFEHYIALISRKFPDDANAQKLIDSFRKSGK
ncbi:MAG: tetratricopeptide repeat protein [Candidatus Omnitrophica bacterium]|nr:tetratricopeptide repeat protein [Candidatus Omnitrophota bacterium]